MKKNDTAPSGTSHKVVFKADAFAGSSLHMAVYGYDGTMTPASSLSGITRTSIEIITPTAASVASVSVCKSSGKKFTT